MNINVHENKWKIWIISKKIISGYWSNFLYVDFSDQINQHSYWQDNAGFC